jgi:hypothetical protein
MFFSMAFLKILHGRPGFKARVHSLSYSHTSHTSLGYKRQVKNWEENEFYDSDEDTFLDRTGDSKG